jgi:SRSO17 transposase
MSQVGTFLAYANGQVWTWVDGELFLPEKWFAPEMAKERERLGIPAERQFQTKIELGWEMIKRTKSNGLPFEAFACDDLYGRSAWLRAQLRQGDIVYIADVPQSSVVYLHKPFVGLPVPSHRRRGRRPTRCRVLKNATKVSVQDVGILPDTLWQQVRVRTTERGEIVDQFAARRVWTLFNDQPVEEWLVIRREASGRCTYAFSNAPAETSLSHLAWLKCQRYFVERTNQDAKSEAGFDELQAQKYLAWEHHLALTVMATWFVAQTKLQWAENYPHDPTLLHQFEVEVLPTLSMANVRALLRAAMPLPELTPETAASLVAEHLVNRTRSRKSRMKYKSNTREPSS